MTRTAKTSPVEPGGPDAPPMIVRTRSLIVLPPGESLASDRAFLVSVEDEGGGPFILIEMQADSGLSPGTVSIDPQEWAPLADAVERLLREWAGQ